MNGYEHDTVGLDISQEKTNFDEFHFVFSNNEGAQLLFNENDCPEIVQTSDEPAVILIEEDLDEEMEKYAGPSSFWYNQQNVDTSSGTPIFKNKFRNLSPFDLKYSKSQDSDKMLGLKEHRNLEEENFKMINVKKSGRITKIPWSVKEAINDEFQRLILKQFKINDGKFYKGGPGRHRKNPYKTSAELKLVVQDYMATRLGVILDK